MKVLMRSLIAAGAFAVGLALSAHDAAATTIFSDNFDSSGDVALTSSPPYESIGNTTYWNAAGTAGLLNYTQYNFYTSTGQLSPPNVAFAEPGSSLTTNTLANGLLGNLAANTTYTFYATIGNLNNNPGGTNPANFQAELFANATLVADLSGGGLASGATGNFQETFDSANLSSLVGDALSIELVDTDSFGAASYDNITLNATCDNCSSAIPEPPTGLPLLGIALLGFVAYHYRQKTRMLAL